MEVLPPYKGLTDKGMEVYFEHLKDRFTDAQFKEAISEIIVTQREFPKISDLILRSQSYYQASDALKKRMEQLANE